MLGIHTAQSLAPIGGEDGLLELCAKPYLREAMIVLDIADPLAVPRGLIIAVCTLADCRVMVENQTQLDNWTEPAVLIPYGDPVELAFGDWRAGRYAWKLTGMAILRDPIRATGRQRLWEWNDPLPSLLAPATPPTADTTRPPHGRKPRSLA